jgi:hypothetical protein
LIGSSFFAGTIDRRIDEVAAGQGIVASAVRWGRQPGPDAVDVPDVMRSRYRFAMPPGSGGHFPYHRVGHCGRAMGEGFRA